MCVYEQCSVPITTTKKLDKLRSLFGMVFIQRYFWYMKRTIRFITIGCYLEGGCYAEGCYWEVYIISMCMFAFVCVCVCVCVSQSCVFCIHYSTTTKFALWYYLNDLATKMKLLSFINVLDIIISMSDIKRHVLLRIEEM